MQACGRGVRGIAQNPQLRGWFGALLGRLSNSPRSPTDLLISLSHIRASLYSFLAHAGESSRVAPQSSQQSAPRAPWLTHVVAPEVFYPPPRPPLPRPQPRPPAAAAPKPAAQPMKKPSKAEQQMIQGQQVSISRAISRRLCANVAAKHSEGLFATVRVENVTMLTARCA